MDFDKLSNAEKIALIEAAVQIHNVSINRQIPIVYGSFEECAKSMVEKAKIIANQM